MVVRRGQNLDAFHVRCKRRILGLKQTELVCNFDVENASGQMSFHVAVNRRCVRLFGHIARMRDIVSAKADLSTACGVRDGRRPSTYWKRPRGRPPTTWLNQVTTDCCFNATDAVRLSLDCSM